MILYRHTLYQIALHGITGHRNTLFCIVLISRCFCYVDDMIDGLIAMMNSKEQGPINIGNPYNEFTLNELVQEFEMVVDRQLSVKFIEATENDPKQRKPDITKKVSTETVALTIGCIENRLATSKTNVVGLSTFPETKTRSV